MDMKKIIAAAFGMLALNVGGMSLRAEDAPAPDTTPPVANPPAANPDNPQSAPGQDAPHHHWRNRDNNGGPGGPGGPGAPGGPGGAGGPSGLMQVLNGGGGKSMLLQMASRMAGTPLEDPKSLAKVDNLPLGAQRRFVLQIPVGGIDTLSEQGSGWKMEQVFSLTEEQSKAVSALRDEYAQKQKELEEKIAAQQKALADEAIALRAGFEKRANDILTGADKEAKQKLDALAQDAETKNAAAASDALSKLQDANPRQLFGVARSIREETDKTAQEARTSMLNALPADIRAKAEDLFKELDAQKTKWDNTQNWRHHGGMRQNEQPQPPQKEAKDF